MKFIQGTEQTSDNKYVQYRLTADDWSTSTFDWERYNDITTSNNQDADLEFSDEQGNVLIRASNGHIKTKNFDSSKDASEEERGLMSAIDKIKLNTIEGGAEVNDVETREDLSDVDLDFSDEQGNVLTRFSNGHIKTKNFDSSDFTNSLKNKLLCIVGDSISTYSGYLPANYATYYPMGDVDSVTKCWWYQVASKYEMQLNNCSYSGSRTAGNSLEESTIDSVTGRGACGCSNNRVLQVGRFGEPNYIIITLGTNDFHARVPIGAWNEKLALPAEGTITEFSSAYALMLAKLQRTYKDAKIICCTILAAQAGDTDDSPEFPCKNANNESIQDFNECIKRLASIFCCEILELNRCGINYYNIQNYSFQNVDHQPNLHPNAAGQRLMGQAVIDFFKSKK